MPEVLRFLSVVRIADVLDVLVVAVLLYVIARWLFRRATVAVAVGLSLVLILYLAARYWGMYLTLAAFRGGAVFIVVVLAIVFQEDIRRGIERLAAWRPGRLNGMPHPIQEVKEILVEAVANLAERGSGALIVLAGRQPLEAHVRGGIKLNGRPSLPLLLSIFDHKTPGHDGAAILDEALVTNFAVHLPLSKDVASLGGKGTRHAAALGLSESCDAMVIVVSEERGTISIAEHGTLQQLESPAGLHKRLDAFYKRQAYALSSPQTTTGRAADWSLKASSLAVACLLWVVFAFRVDIVEQVAKDVPVEYRNLPSGWQVERADPAALDVRLSGPERAFDQLDRESLRVSLDRGVYDLKRGLQEIEVPPEAIKLPPGIQMAAGVPPVIRLTLEQTVTIESSLRPWLVGKPPAGHRLGKVTVDPAKLRISVPSRYSVRARTLRTEPISLEDVTESFQREVSVELPAGATLIDRPNDRVELTVEVLPVDRDGG